MTSYVMLALRQRPLPSRFARLPPAISGLPEIGIVERRKSDISDLRKRERGRKARATFFALSRIRSRVYPKIGNY